MIVETRVVQRNDNSANTMGANPIATLVSFLPATKQKERAKTRRKGAIIAGVTCVTVGLIAVKVL